MLTLSVTSAAPVLHVRPALYLLYCTRQYVSACVCAEPDSQPEKKCSVSEHALPEAAERMRYKAEAGHKRQKAEEAAGTPKKGRKHKAALRLPNTPTVSLTRPVTLLFCVSFRGTPAAEQRHLPQWFHLSPLWPHPARWATCT